MSITASSLVPDARPFAEKFWLSTAIVALIGLLTTPLPTAWVGLAAFAAVLVGRGRSLVRAGLGMSFWLPVAPYLGGALVGYSVTVRPETAQIRLFGMLAGVAACALVALAAVSPNSARRVASAMLGITIVATPIVFLVVTPFLLPLDLMPSGLFGWVGAFEPIRQFVLGQDDILQRYRLRASGLGTLAAFGIGLALGPLLTGRDRQSRAMASLAMLYFGAFLLIAGNRGAMLSAVVVTTLLVAGRIRWLIGGGVAVALGVLVLVIVSGLSGVGPNGSGNHVRDVFSSLTTELGSIQRRLEFWDNTVFLLGDFRFTGVGLGIRSVQEIYEAYFIPIEPRFSHSHNIFLQTYLEQGLLGLIGFIGLVFVGLVGGWRALARVHQAEARSAVVSSTGAALVLLVAGLTEIVALTAVGMVMLFTALALILVAQRFASDPAPVRKSSARSDVAQRIAVGATTLSLLGLIAGWPFATYAQSQQPTTDLPLRESSFVDRLVSAFELNQGAVEVTKVSIGVDRPRAERDERLTNAEMHLRNALERDPVNLGVYRNLAAVHVVQSQRSAARRLLTQAEALATPDDERTAFQIGRLYRDNGDVERAIDAWTRAGAVRQLMSWGSAAIRRNQWRTAIDVNYSAIRAAPPERSPWHGLAVGMDEVSGVAAAVMRMEELAESYPSIPWPCLEAGDLLSAHGDRAQALEWYRRAAAIAPDDPAIQERLAASQQPEDSLTAS